MTLIIEIAVGYLLGRLFWNVITNTIKIKGVEWK